jgi:hypothetical protein
VFAIGDALGDALVRPGKVIVRLVFGQDGAQMPLAKDQRTGSSSSRRKVPARRSQIAFLRGACTAVRTILVPVARKTASNEMVKFEPRSRSQRDAGFFVMSVVRAQLKAVLDGQFRQGGPDKSSSPLSRRMRDWRMTR